MAQFELAHFSLGDKTTTKHRTQHADTHTHTPHPKTSIHIFDCCSILFAHLLRSAIFSIILIFRRCCRFSQRRNNFGVWSMHDLCKSMFDFGMVIEWCEWVFFFFASTIFVHQSHCARKAIFFIAIVYENKWRIEWFWHRHIFEIVVIRSSSKKRNVTYITLTNG